MKKLRKCRTGFTLLELIMVLVILVALAGLIIPIVGFTRDQSDAGNAAVGGTGLVSSLQTFKASTGKYPDRMDSLLADDGSGTLAEYDAIWHHAGPPSPWFTAEDVSAIADTSYSTSLAHASITEVMDHDATELDPNSSGKILRAFFGASGDMTVAVVTDDGVLSAAGVSDLDNDGDVAEHIPDDDSSGNPDVKYVAFGIGPECEAVGATMATAPLHSASDPGDYGRFIAIFAVYESGKAAQLATVVDSRRSSIDSNLNSFREVVPE